MITYPSFAELAETLSQINVVDSIGRPVSDLSKVEMLQGLEEGSLGFYSMLRSVSDQKRQAELKEALGQFALCHSNGNNATTTGLGTCGPC